MKKIFFIFSLLISLIAIAQNDVSVKKGDIKVNGTIIATYDGKGGFLKAKRIGVFAPGSKDTLISILENEINFRNPLWPDYLVYYDVKIPSVLDSVFYVKHPLYPTRRMVEKDIVELIFNDTLPVLVNNGKIDKSALLLFKEKYSYDHEKALRFIKGVEDTIALINANIAIRDLAKPVTFKIITDEPSIIEAKQVLDVYQDNVLLGRVIKKIRGGTLTKAMYTIWKNITPVIVDGIDLKYSPVATCTTGPSGSEIPVITVVGKNELKVKGDYSRLELQIINVLIANKFL